MSLSSLISRLCPLAAVLSMASLVACAHTTGDEKVVGDQKVISDKKVVAEPKIYWHYGATSVLDGKVQVTVDAFCDKKPQEGNPSMNAPTSNPGKVISGGFSVGEGVDIKVSRLYSDNVWRVIATNRLASKEVAQAFVVCMRNP